MRSPKHGKPGSLASHDGSRELRSGLALFRRNRQAPDARSRNEI